MKRSLALRLLMVALLGCLVTATGCYYHGHDHYGYDDHHYGGHHH